jgi:hypothetical protein
MRLNRTLFPELALFATETEAREALRHARSQLDRRNSFWLAALVLAGVIVVLILSLPYLGVPLSVLGPSRILVGIGVGAMGSWMILLPFRNAIRRSLRAQLVSNGVPICITCGYDLSHLSADRCPECGTAAA